MELRERGITRRLLILPIPLLGWLDVNWYNQTLVRYWKEPFRMSKDTFYELLAIVSPHTSCRDMHFHPAIPVEKHVAIALWGLANGPSYRTIATNFCISKANCVEITRQFCQALCRMAKEYSSTMQNIARAVAAFQEISEVPQAIGAIDGTHIEIVAPIENPANYFDREQTIQCNAASGGGRKCHVSGHCDRLSWEYV